MSKTKLFAIPIFLLTLVAAVGCDSGGSDLDTGADPNALDSDQFAVVGAEDAFANIEDADLQQPIRMNPPMRGDSFARHPRHRDHPGAHLKGILRDLQLSSDQMEQIRELLEAHRERVRDELEGLRAANAPILEQARQEREQILAKLESGEITREEAMQLMRELSERTREAIRNNPDNAPFRAAICDSTSMLFDGVRAVLESEQQKIWDVWVAGLSGPCQTE